MHIVFIDNCILYAYINLFLAWYISKMSKTILEILFRTLRTYKILLLCILRLTTDIIYVIHYHEYHIIKTLISSQAKSSKPNKP